MVARQKAIEVFYPEVHAGGFSRVDSTVEFYLRVNVLVTRDMTILDLGAGRGAEHADQPDDFKTALRNFRGRCKKVIGADVDPAVLSNTSLDEALTIGRDGRIPVNDSTIDLIFCDWTFEHIIDPGQFCAEMNRILKSGGWICARTPNKFGYIALVASLIPNSLHTRILNIVQPNRKNIDVFPTAYQLNSRRAFRSFFPDRQWSRYVYACNPEPAYFGESLIAWGIMTRVAKFLPEFFAAVFMFYAKKMTPDLASHPIPGKHTSAAIAELFQNRGPS